MRFLSLPHNVAAGLAAATLLLLTESTFAQAREAASPMPMDCGQASMMMDQARKTAPPAMTGDIDHDTAAAMQMHLSMAMQMAKLEAACGKNPKMQAAAKKMLDNSSELVNEIQRLSSPY